MEKSRSTSSGGQSDGNEDRVEENIQTMARNSYASAANGGEGILGSSSNRGKENSKNMEMCYVAGFRKISQ